MRSTSVLYELQLVDAREKAESFGLILLLVTSFFFFSKRQKLSVSFSFKKKDILVVLFEVINPFELLHGVHLILPQDR